ncbi:MAG TPA: hypothetical protein VJR58_08795 [Vineibacter sp.]|nr:hypothetical protein [Vineibacter sp.]
MVGEASDGTTTVRLIDAGGTSILRAQALHAGIADAMSLDDTPVVVLANPDAAFVSVGAHQDVMREVDVQSCVNTDTPIIRRATGGPALVLSADDTLVHVVLPRIRPEARIGLGGLYTRFAEPLVRTWHTFGLPVEHDAWGGISFGRYRVGGVQAGLVGHTLIVGGNLLRTFDADTIAQRASLPSDEVRTQIRDAVRDGVGRANRPLESAVVREVLLDHVGSTLGWTMEPSSLRDDELAAVERREAQMGTSEHVFSGGRRLARGELRAVRGLALVDLIHRGAGGLVRLRLLERAGVIEDIEITGELTCLPVDGLETLASRLIGLRRDAPDLAGRIHSQVGLLGLELSGVTAADLATALRPVMRPAGPDPLDLLFGDGQEH